MPLFGYVPAGTSGPLRRGWSSNLASRYRSGRRAWLDVGDPPGEVFEKVACIRAMRPSGRLGGTSIDPRCTGDALVLEAQ